MLYEAGTFLQIENPLDTLTLKFLLCYLFDRGKFRQIEDCAEWGSILSEVLLYTTFWRLPTIQWLLVPSKKRLHLLHHAQSRQVHTTQGG